jgi:hypothetical protein
MIVDSTSSINFDSLLFVNYLSFKDRKGLFRHRNALYP